MYMSYKHSRLHHNIHAHKLAAEIYLTTDSVIPTLIHVGSLGYVPEVSTSTATGIENAGNLACTNVPRANLDNRSAVSMYNIAC